MHSFIPSAIRRYRSQRHAHQLALGLLNLVVQAAQHALDRAAVVVLYKLYIETGDLGKVALVEAFKKKPRASLNTLGSRISTSCKAVGVTV